jgi:hypothetical protein
VHVRHGEAHLLVREQVLERALDEEPFVVGIDERRVAREQRDDDAERSARFEHAPALVHELREAVADVFEDVVGDDRPDRRVGEREALADRAAVEVALGVVVGRVLVRVEGDRVNGEQVEVHEDVHSRCRVLVDPDAALLLRAAAEVHVEVDRVVLRRARVLSPIVGLAARPVLVLVDVRVLHYRSPSDRSNVAKRGSRAVAASQ